MWVASLVLLSRNASVRHKNHVPVRRRESPENFPAFCPTKRSGSLSACSAQRVAGAVAATR
eukprot:2517356-Pyramimonas_sp.AAC.1